MPVLQVKACVSVPSCMKIIFVVCACVTHLVCNVYGCVRVVIGVVTIRW